MEGDSRPGPRLLVVKGTFEQFGGAERDLLNNLSAWQSHFNITLISLNLPAEASERLAALGVEAITPVKQWSKPTGALAEINAKASRSAKKEWRRLLADADSGLAEALDSADAIHITSGVGSLEFAALVPEGMPLHYHCLEPHRGLHEGVLHRRIDGRPKRPLAITETLLTRQRRSDIRLTQAIASRGHAAISGNSPWIQQRIKDVYGIEAGILLPTVNTTTWSTEQMVSSPIEGDYVVSIGNASWVKGTWETVEMLAGSGLSLALVGGGDEADLVLLQQRATALGVGLHLMPRLSQGVLVALVKGARAVVSLAHAEPFGLTPVEAQAAGTPAIMVDEGGFSYTVEDGVSGRLLPRPVTGESHLKWHAALAEAADPHTREAWRQGGLANITEMGLRPQDQAARLAEIVGTLLMEK